METDFKKKLKIKYNLKFLFHIFFIFIKKFRIIQYLKKNKANYESLFKRNPYISELFGIPKF